jgi:cholesterol oxidase
VEYDAIVVGSGFGGTIATTMLAESGKRVLVLERGSWWMSPEDAGKPRAETSAMRDWLERNGQSPRYWPRPDHSKGLLALFACARTRRNRAGLYVWSRFGEVTVVTSSAVGGGSMIYSNVTRRAPQAALDAIGLGLRQAEYDAAIAWMDRFRGPLSQIVTKIPLPASSAAGPGVPDYLYLDRSRVLRDAAAGVAAKRPDAAVAWFPLDLSVFEYDPHRGAASGSGRHQTFCQRQGRCIFGCLPGAKQTLDRSLFASASDPGSGVTLLPLAEARLLRRVGDGYEIELRDHRDGGKTKRVRAPRVFLAAGTLGTTELLLRSRANGGIALSDRLGQGFSTNGDFGAFIETDREVEVNSAHGPINTSGVSVTVGARHFTFEDTGIPTMAAPLLSKAVALASLRIECLAAPPLSKAVGLATATVRGSLLRGKVWFARRFRVMLPELRRLLPPLRPKMLERDGWRTEAEAVENLFLFHVMGQDEANGTFILRTGLLDTLLLRRGTLDLRWKGNVAKQDTFKQAEALCQEFATEMKGRYVSLAQGLPGGGNLTITHPLGGCGIGASSDEGVVDEYGRVYDPTRDSKTAVHDGLYVVDGSAIPGPLAVNPSLTIAAQALKSVTAAIRE